MELLGALLGIVLIFLSFYGCFYGIAWALFNPKKFSDWYIPHFVLVGFVLWYLLGFYAFLLCLLAWVIYNKLTLPAKRETARDHLINAVELHYSALKRNIDKSIKINDYGAITEDKRVDVIIEFLESINHNPSYISFDTAADIVLETLYSTEARLLDEGFDARSYPEDGLDFEYWVAENLKKFGWEAWVTQGSGDQGVDVIAEKNDTKVGIQCKRYNKNVGNKAVQQIISARGYFDLDKAAVLSTSDYTKSAKELAEKSDVKLLSQYDIQNFDELFLPNQPDSVFKILDQWVQVPSIDESTEGSSFYILNSKRIIESEETYYICFSVQDSVIAIAASCNFNFDKQVQITIDNNDPYISKLYIDDAAIFEDIVPIVREMKAGKKLTLTFTKLSNESIENIPFSLKGFTKIYDETFSPD